MKRKWMLMGLYLVAGLALANTPPTPVIVSCAMREGTTLMDITYRVNDPDDARVSAWPLAFVDGVRSFAKVIRPTTFAEGTENNFGTNVLANTDHQLVWNVGADWNIDLGQLKFEIICKDSRGLLPFDWVSIPATETSEALTISKNSITNSYVINALFYQYALGDTGLSLSNGVLTGTTISGIFRGIELVSGTNNKTYATPYIMKQMNLQPALSSDVSLALAARVGITNVTNSWYARSQPYVSFSNLVVAIGTNYYGVCTVPARMINVNVVSAGCDHNLALTSNGNLVSWGYNNYGQCNVPAGLSNVTAISAGGYVVPWGESYSLALKSDGTVVAWGYNNNGQCNVPAGLSNVTAIVAGRAHSLALKSDGTVVAWGWNSSGQCTVPAGLSNVTAMAAGWTHSLSVKSNGTVVAWGSNGAGQCNVPSTLSNVTAIAAGASHSLALKSDGTVVAWGLNSNGQCTVPAGLSNVMAIAAGTSHSVALINDGTVVAWGSNSSGQCSVPVGLSSVTAIGAGSLHTLMIVKEP